MKRSVFLLVAGCLIASARVVHTQPAAYADVPFWQDYSEKFALPDHSSQIELRQVRSDRNGAIQVLSTAGLLKPNAHRLVPDRMYRPLVDMEIHAIGKHESQFVYLTKEAVLSNAWAGKFYVRHDMSAASRFALGSDFELLIADKQQVAYYENGNKTWTESLESEDPAEVLYDSSNQAFLVLTQTGLHGFDPSTSTFSRKYAGKNLTSMALADNNSELVIGTSDGYLKLDAKTFRPTTGLVTKLPWTDITCVAAIGDKIWFGTTRGAFAVKQDGAIDYYASQRWLVDDEVVDVAAGPENSVLVLTKHGLSQIHFVKTTLAEKARHYQEIQRRRHIRYGLNSQFVMTKPGDFGSGTLIDSDNDGLWTSMYLAGELFRYAVTKSEAALQNCYEAFEGMERLDLINPLKGFPSRSYERRGYSTSDLQKKSSGGESIWRPVEGGLWTWKSTTSSDESVGHFLSILFLPSSSRTSNGGRERLHRFSGKSTTSSNMIGISLTGMVDPRAGEDGTLNTSTTCQHEWATENSIPP